MRNKRSNGEGSFRKDERRNLWIYSLSYDVDGQKGRKQFAGKTKGAAKQKAEMFIEGLKKPSDKRYTVEKWCEYWLNSIARPQVRERTFEKYRSTLKNYVIPYMGELSLDGVNAGDLQEHLNDLLVSGGVKGTGISPSTVKATRKYLMQALDYAVERDLMASNPVRKTKPPKSEKEDVVILSDEQVAKLLDETDELDNPFIALMMRTIFTIAIHSGLRQGELFALDWKNGVDFKNGCLVVTKTLSRIVGKGAVFCEPKTRTSRRNIPMSEKDMQLLKRYREEQLKQEKQAIEYGFGYVNMHNLVFTSPNGQPVHVSNFSRRYFRPLMRAAGIPDTVTFHAFRHTHATRLLEQGVNVKLIQQRLGHSNITTTLDIYSHVTQNMARDVIKAIENFPE